MGTLPEEGRARIRALAMWLIAAVVAVGVGVAGYAAFLGFPVSTPTTVTAAAVINDGRGLLVRYQVGSSSCQVPGEVTVTETAESVTLEIGRASCRGGVCISRQGSGFRNDEVR